MEKVLKDFVTSDNNYMMSQKVNIAKVNTDHNLLHATKFRVRSIPSCLLFKDGKLLVDIVGYVPEEVLITQILKQL